MQVQVLHGSSLTLCWLKTIRSSLSATLTYSNSQEYDELFAPRARRHVSDKEDLIDNLVFLTIIL
jgi:hypothetical protein